MSILHLISGIVLHSNIGWFLCYFPTNFNCRGARFTLSRDELLTLPEFVLLSLFPNGLLPDGHMGFAEGDVYPVDVGDANLLVVRNAEPVSQICYLV